MILALWNYPCPPTFRFVVFYRYKAEFLRFALKALSLGSKLAIKQDVDGILSLQVYLIAEVIRCLDYHIRR